MSRSVAASVSEWTDQPSRPMLLTLGRARPWSKPTLARTKVRPNTAKANGDRYYKSRSERRSICSRSPPRNKRCYGKRSHEVRRSILPGEIRGGPLKRHLLDPDIAITHVVSFGLQLQSSRRVGDAASTIIAAIQPRVRPTPHLLNLDIVVHLDAVEK